MKIFGAVGQAMFMLCAAMPVLAGGITIGGPGNPADGNCLGFGCGQMYQQLYDASQFEGRLTITGLTFFNGNYTAGSIAEANYLIMLSTTPVAVADISEDFGANFGDENLIFFSGFMGGAIGPTREFTISGLPYLYDPSEGNLLLSVLVDGSGIDSSVYLDFTNHAAPNTFSRAFRFGENGSMTGVDRNSGLVTRFEYSDIAPAPREAVGRALQTEAEAAAAAIPEPGTNLLIMLGGGAMLLMFGKRRGTPAAVRARQ